MSCSDSIITYTNARNIYKGVNRWKQVFSCGKCSSCISKQRTDWRVRSYYEARNCLRSDSNNFVLFDTLTYSDEHIKRYADVFPNMKIPHELNSYCFSRDDVQKFFKRLRVNLERAGYDIESRLRYILTSEYGSSEQTNGFRNTHRPHYHLLFFVSFPIDPIDFSRFVSQSWHLGKTDGVRPGECSECPVRKFCKGACIYQSENYVLTERLVRNGNDSNCMKCVNYVTKYVSKDMYITSELSDKVDNLFAYLYPDYRTNILHYRLYRRFRNQVLPFHLQSRGFGLSLLDDEDEKKYINKYNRVRLPTGDCGVIKAVAVPRYYERKMYYDFKKVDGRVKWSLNFNGLSVKMQQLDRRIYGFINNFRVFDSKISNDKLFNLAVYNCVYSRTLANQKYLSLPYHQYYYYLLCPHDDTEKPLYVNRATFIDKLTIGKFISTREIIDEDGEVHYKNKQVHRSFVPFDGYEVITDKSRSDWHGFDKLLDQFRIYNMKKGRVRDSVAYNDDVQLDRYKQLGLKV